MTRTDRFPVRHFAHDWHLMENTGIIYSIPLRCYLICIIIYPVTPAITGKLYSAKCINISSVLQYPSSMTSPTATIEVVPSTSVDEKLEPSSSKDAGTHSETIVTKEFGFLPIPRHLRYDPTKPFHFGLLLNIGFGFASTFSEFLAPFHQRLSNITISLL